MEQTSLLTISVIVDSMLFHKFSARKSVRNRRGQLKRSFSHKHATLIDSPLLLWILLRRKKQRIPCSLDLFPGLHCKQQTMSAPLSHDLFRHTKTRLTGGSLQGSFEQHSHVTRSDHSYPSDCPPSPGSLSFPAPPNPSSS